MVERPHIQYMEAVALFLAIFRKPLFAIVMAALLIGYARENPWTAAALVAALITVVVITAIAQQKAP